MVQRSAHLALDNRAQEALRRIVEAMVHDNVVQNGVSKKLQTLIGPDGNDIIAEVLAIRWMSDRFEKPRDVVEGVLEKFFKT